MSMPADSRTARRVRVGQAIECDLRWIGRGTKSQDVLLCDEQCTIFTNLRITSQQQYFWYSFLDSIMGAGLGYKLLQKNWTTSDKVFLRTGGHSKALRKPCWTAFHQCRDVAEELTVLKVLRMAKEGRIPPPRPHDLRHPSHFCHAFQNPVTL